MEVQAKRKAVKVALIRTSADAPGGLDCDDEGSDEGGANHIQVGSVVVRFGPLIF